MAEYRLSNLAILDIEDILHWSIESFGLDRAERYKDDLGRCMQRVADDPRMGRIVEGSDVYLRYSCGQHVVFFSLGKDEVFVVRVLHARRDFKQHLPRAPRR
jgi:toxin ParE1/3/4